MGENPPRRMLIGVAPGYGGGVGGVLGRLRSEERQRRRAVSVVGADAMP